MDSSGSGKVAVAGYYQYPVQEYSTGKTRSFLRYMEWIARWRFHSNYCTDIKHRADCYLHYCRCSRADYAYIYIQGVTGGRDQTSGGCSLM